MRFERWEGVAVPEDATNEQVLAAYRPWLDKLMGETGAGSAAAAGGAGIHACL